jgi:hypothetical protein
MHGVKECTQGFEVFCNALQQKVYRNTSLWQGFKGHVKFCDFFFTINEFDFSIMNNKIYNSEYELN